MKASFPTDLHALFRLLRKPAGQALRLPLRAVPGPCADHVVYGHRPSHVDRRVCRGNAAAAGGQCPLPVPIMLCAGTVRPTWTILQARITPPQAQPHNRPAGRSRLRDRVRETDKKKRVNIIGASLLAAVIVVLFFIWPAAIFTHTKTWFSGNEIRRCPLADEGGCSFNEAQSAASFCAAARQCRIAESRGALLP